MPDRERAAWLFIWVLAPLAGIVAHLRVTGTWWFHDDWVFLADAAGIAARDDSPVRVLGYSWYWSLFYPLFGLKPLGWAVTRLLLHAGATLLVIRIAAHCGLTRPARYLAGLLWATSALAFEVLYWGTGAVELLSAFFAIAAIERWLAGGRWGPPLALLCGILSMLSKESGLLLPVLLAATLVWRRSRQPLAWTVVGLLAGFAVLTGRWIAGEVSTMPRYGLSLGSVATNFATLGAWLLTPGRYLHARYGGSAVLVVAGMIVWGGWLVYALARARRGSGLQLACWLAAVLVVAPSTPLSEHLVPRYAYAAAAPLAIALGALFFRRTEPLRLPAAVLLLALLTGAAWDGTAARIDGRWPTGRKYHHLALKEDVSRWAIEELKKAPVPPGGRILIIRDADADPKLHELLYESLAGDLGPRLVLGADVEVDWVDDLDPDDVGPRDRVFVESEEHILPAVFRTAGDAEP